MLLDEGIMPPCTVAPGAGVSGCPRVGDGVFPCSEETEEEGDRERSRGRVVKIPMVGVR